MARADRPAAPRPSPIGSTGGSALHLHRARPRSRRRRRGRRARPAVSPSSPLEAKRRGPISAATPTKPIAKPAILRQVSRSPGTSRWASGSTMIATVAIEIPAKPEVTVFCPQLSSMNGTAVENMPDEGERSPGGGRGAGVKQARRRDARRPRPAAARRRPIRAAASQNGVMPSSAISITMKVAPQMRPRDEPASPGFRTVIMAAGMPSPARALRSAAPAEPRRNEKGPRGPGPFATVRIGRPVSSWPCRPSCRPRSTASCRAAFRRLPRSGGRR